MYSTNEPFGRLRIWITKGEEDKPGYERHLVEVLGTGQQYLVYGTHPSGSSYEWESNIAEIIPDALTPITREQAEKYRLALARFVNGFGYTTEMEGDGTPSSKTAADQMALRAPTLDAVYEVMSYFPNNTEFSGRNEWLNVGYAIKASCGSENEHEAKQIFIDWSMKWPGNANHPKGNTPEGTAEEFRRLKGPYRIGWPWLQEQARGFGYNNAADDFEALEPEPEPREEELPALVKALNSEYALVKELPDTVLCTPDDDDVSLMNTRHWKNHVSLPPKLSARWLRHPKRREYRRLVMDPTFPPHTAVPNGTRLDDFNLWEGFPIEPSTEGSCDLFLDHIGTIICDGDPKLKEWVINWMADIVQNPGRPVGTALVLRGDQGAGKDTVGEVLGAIFGERHYTVVSSPEEVTGSFNPHLEGRILLHAEEAFFAGDKRTVGRLKSLITSPRLRINQKHLPTYEVANLIRLFITSNEGWVVPAGLGERRFAVLDVSKARAKDRTYFHALRRQMFSEDGCERLLHHLLYEVKVDRDLISQPPPTRALLSQQERGFSGMQRWAMECARVGRLPGGGSQPETEAVFSAIRPFFLDRRELDRATRTSIGEFLPKYGVVKRLEGSGKRLYRYVFPPLPEFRAALASDLSVTPEWEDADEWEPENAELSKDLP